jgi:Zn-dependent protease
MDVVIGNSKWSIPLGKVAGIKVRLHLSFFLLVILVVATAGSASMSTVVGEIWWLAAVFVCVLIHEVCHSVAARRVGITVRDIVLLPIGGVSEMEEMPKEPRRELWISAAGPLGSVALAGLALVAAAVSGGHPWPPTLFAGSIAARIGWMNVMLAAFNLIPALPLDGGRMFRSVMALRLGRARATAAAVLLGRAGGVALMVFGFFYDLWLLVIGMFVYFGASAEGRVQELEQRSLRGVPVQAAMISPAWVADEGHVLTPDSARRAFQRQGVLPITSRGGYMGLVGEDEIGLAATWGETVAGRIANRDAPAVRAWDNLDTVLDVLRRSGWPALAVLAPDRTVVGVVRSDDVVGVLEERGRDSAWLPAETGSRAA